MYGCVWLMGTLLSLLLSLHAKRLNITEQYGSIRSNSRFQAFRLSGAGLCCAWSVNMVLCCLPACDDDDDDDPKQISTFVQ